MGSAAGGRQTFLCRNARFRKSYRACTAEVAEGRGGGGEGVAGNVAAFAFVVFVIIIYM